MRLRWSTLLDAVLVTAALSTAVVVWKRLSSNQDGVIRAPTLRVGNWREQLRSSRRVGPESAPFQLLVWTDYQCPACRQLEAEIHRLRERLGDSLSVVYRYFPLRGHDLAFPAAAAAECAFSRGGFPLMHEALFATDLSGDSIPVAALAEKSGVMSASELRDCMMNSATLDVVRREKAVGDSMGFRGTPYVQIKDRLSLGGMPAEQLDSALRSK